MSATLFRADRVIERADRPPLTQGAVRVENGLITAVGPAADFGDRFDGRVVDLGQATLLPGLIDGHAHLCLDAAIPDWPARFEVGEIELTLRAVRCLAQDLHAGVTTARCLGDRSFIDVACRAAVAEGRLAGPRLVAASRGLRSSRGHGLVGYPCDGPENYRRMVRENVAAGADFIKLFLTGTLLEEPLPCFPGREEVQAAVDEAHRAGLAVTAHCVGGLGFDLALEVGLDCLEHGYFLTAAQIQRLAESDRWLVLTPSPYLSDEWLAGLPPAMAANFRRGREAAAATMAAIIQAGVRFALGSDGLHGRLDQDVQYLVDLGAAPAQALAAATLHAAQVCGLGERTGALRPGRAADLLAVAGDPLTDPVALSRVRAVVARGEIVRQSW